MHAHQPIAPAAEGLNGWRKIKFKRKEEGGDAAGDESDSGDDGGALIQAVNQLTASIVPPAWGTVDAADDKAAAGNAEDGYYYTW